MQRCVTAVGSTTFAAASSTSRSAPAARTGSRLPGRGVLSAEPVVEQPASAQGERREQRRPAGDAGFLRACAVYPPSRVSNATARPERRGAVASSASAATSSSPDLFPCRKSSSASCSSARLPGIGRVRQRLQPRLEQRGSPWSSSCCAHSRLARSRSSGSADESPATWSHSVAAPRRSPASALSAASRSRARVA